MCPETSAAFVRELFIGNMALAMCLAFYSTVFAVSRRRHVVAREGAITVQAAHVEDAESARPAVDARLAEESKRWQPAEVVPSEHGETLEYRVRLKKKADPRTLLDSLNAAAQPYGATVEYHEYRDRPVGPHEGG